MVEVRAERATKPEDDLEEIRQLKYRYFRFLDLKQWDEFANCLTPECTADYAGLVFADRDALVSYMSDNMGPGLISMHHGHHPEIVVDGDSATGTWYLEDKVIVPDLDFVLEGAAFYEDTYTRTPDGWRISSTGYRRTYELSSTLAGAKVRTGTAYERHPLG